MAQLSLAERDYMITFPSDRADQPFSKSILAIAARLAGH
jgi:hypothetical protein